MGVAGMKEFVIPGAVPESMTIELWRKIMVKL
jgi:hypothetical protein